MSDRGKILGFPEGGKSEDQNDGLDIDVITALDEFITLLHHHKARSFAAVAMTDGGEVIDTWHAGCPVQMIGAMELLKSSLLLHTISCRSVPIE